MDQRLSRGKSELISFQISEYADEDVSFSRFVFNVEFAADFRGKNCAPLFRRRGDYLPANRGQIPVEPAIHEFYDACVIIYQFHRSISARGLSFVY